jgi:DNA-binding LacI/PurR family transcriptional regulator
VAVGRDHALVVSPPGSDWFVWDRVPLDGVIVIEPVVDEPALPDLRRRGVPFVTISTDPMDGHGDAVVRSDDREGTVRMLEHLAQGGGERIGMIAPPPVNAFTSACAETYRRWCEASDRPTLLEVVSMIDVLRDRSGSYAAALERILAKDPTPDALFVPIELAGVLILQLLEERGLTVPGELLLATTKDIGRTEQTQPPLTTLDWDYAELGRRAASLLLDLIDGARSAPCEDVIPTTISPRASTAR